MSEEAHAPWQMDASMRKTPLQFRRSSLRISLSITPKPRHHSLYSFMLLGSSTDLTGKTIHTTNSFKAIYDYSNFRKDGFLKFIDSILALPDVYFVTSQELINWVRYPESLDTLHNSPVVGCDFPDRPGRCGRKKHTCNLKHKGDKRQFASCQRKCPNRYPWVNNLNGD